MARGRSPWKRALDLKPRLGRFFNRLQASSPQVTRVLRYYALTGVLPPDALTENISRPLLMDTPAYHDMHQALLIDNVDGFNADYTAADVNIRTAVLADHFVCGHIMYPVSRATGLMPSFDAKPLPWGLTYPMPSGRPERHITGLAVAIPPVTNYYHLVVEYLMPAIAAILRHPPLAEQGVTFLVSKPFSLVTFMAQVLGEMGINARVEQIVPADTVSADRFLWARSRSHNDEHAYAFAPETAQLGPFIDRLIANVKTPTRIYPLRARTRLRNLENQDELVAALAQKDFASLDLKWSDAIEQVAAFRRSEIVVAVHGAALTNLIWRDGGDVVEIFPANGRKTPYLHIASQHGWNYRYVLGDRERKRQNFSVPVDAVLTALQGVE